MAATNRAWPAPVVRRASLGPDRAGERRAGHVHAAKLRDLAAAEAIEKHGSVIEGPDGAPWVHPDTAPVAAAILAAVEPGIVPGGPAPSGRRDAALHVRRDA